MLPIATRGNSSSSSSVTPGGIVEDIAPVGGGPTYAYTVTELDKGKTKRWNTAGALTITVPVGLSISTTTGNWWAKVYKEIGAGNITLQGDGTSAVVSVGGSSVMTADKGEVLIEQIVTNAFKASGDLGSLASTDISDFTEASQDVIGAMITAAGGSYNDAAGSISLPASNGSRASFGESGSFANFPIIGGAGTNTSGSHSGAFSVLDSSVAATASANLSTIGWKRRQQYTSAAAATNRGAGIRSSTTGVAWAPNAGNSEALRFEAYFGSADAVTGCRGAVGLGWFAGSGPSMSAEPSTFTNAAQDRHQRRQRRDHSGGHQRELPL
jgi:hypothetical protein